MEKMIILVLLMSSVIIAAEEALRQPWINSWKGWLLWKK
jgi:hypothetical protein